jgi:hypothetical protein
MEPHAQTRGPQENIPTYACLRVAALAKAGRGFGGSSAALRNPPKHVRFIAVIVASRITYSSTAKVVVSCVGG